MKKKELLCTVGGNWCSHCGKQYIVVVVQSSVVSDSLWPMDWSMPDFPADHLLEFAQIHVHCVSNTIQPSHPLSPPSPLAFNLFQNQVFSNKSALSIRCPKYLSFSFSICLPMNIHGWSPSGLTGLISFYLRDSQESSPIPQFKIISSSVLGLSLCYGPTLTSIHDYWKNLSFDYMHLFGKLMSLLFNMLFRFAIAFLSMSKHLLISKDVVAVVAVAVVTICSDFGAQKIFSIVSPSICHEVMEPDAMISVFWLWGFKPVSSLPSFTFIKRLFSSSLLSAKRLLSLGWCHLHIWGYWYFSWQSWFQPVLHPAWHFLWCTQLVEISMKFLQKS